MAVAFFCAGAMRSALTRLWLPVDLRTSLGAPKLFRVVVFLSFAGMICFVPAGEPLAVADAFLRRVPAKRGTRACMAERGFTLSELLVACAIVAVLLVVAIPLAQGIKPSAAPTGALVVDAAIAKAQSIAATSGNGATIQFTSGVSDTTIRVYSGRPNGASAMAQAAPDARASASITEASVGTPPFVIFLDTSGHASATSGTVSLSSALASDPGCPSGGIVAITVSDMRSRAELDLPCAH